MKKPADNAQQGGFDFKKYCKVCLKSWYLFAIAVIGCVALAVLYNMVRSTIYEVDAQLKLPTDSPVSGLKIDMAQSFSFGDMFGGSSTDNEIAVLQSHNVFLNTAKDLQLNVWYAEKTNPLKWSSVFTKSPIQVTTLPSIPDTLRTAVTFIVEPKGSDLVDIEVIVRKNTILELKGKTLPTVVDTPYGPFTISKTEYFDKSEAYKMRAVYSSYSQAAEAYTEQVDIFAPNKKTDFIGLAFKTPDPVFGERLLNSIIANYILLNNRQKDDKNLETLDFVNSRLASLQNEIAITEASMEQFKRDNKITLPEQDAAYTLEKLARLELAVIQTETEAKIVKETLDFVSNPDNRYSVIPDLPSAGTPIGTITDDPGSASSVISSATKELNAYNQLVLERMKLINSSAKDGNASVRLIDEQIDALHGSIIASVTRAYETSQVKYREAKRQFDLVQSRIGSIPSLEKEYLSIERNLVVQEQLYLFLLKQREEASMNIAKASHTIEIIDEPYTLAEPLGLTGKMMIVLAAFLGCLAAAAFVFLFKYKKAPLASLAELQQSLHAPLVATIERDRSDYRLITADPSSPASESVRRLRTDLQHILSGCDGKVVAVESMANGEGKTYTAVNLALSLAMTGKSTLLIDASMHDPGVADILGVSSSEGLSEVLSTIKAPDIVEVAAGTYQLAVLTAGAPAANASDLIAGGKMQELVSRLRADYDYIVIDTPAINRHSDALAIAGIPDVTLMVVRIGVTRPATIAQIDTLYDDARLPRMAVVAIK